MKKYEHLFFDLDRTLWDFERNSTETLGELHREFELHKTQVPHEEVFIKKYKEKNQELWAQYRLGQIDKEQLRRERFHQTFLHFDLDEPELALHFNDRYIAICSAKPHLIEGAVEVLKLLKEQYHLHIITNGFVEAQSVKMKNTGLENYFKEVIVSDGLGFRKPDKRIFHHALKSAGASQRNSLMIGDDYEADVLGAKRVGIDQVYFNPEGIQKEATYFIQNLTELKNHL